MLGSGSEENLRQAIPVTVRQITTEDWEAYRDYYKGLANPAHYSGFFEGQDLDAHETYKNLFDNTINTGFHVMFGLWHDDKMIGQTSITLFDEYDPPRALLAGSEIADEYKGQRLVNTLYKARMDYLKEIGFEGEIRTTIRPENTNSQKAALRNGFKNTGRLDEYGYCIFVPTDAENPIKLDSFRQAFINADASVVSPTEGSLQSAEKTDRPSRSMTPT